MSNLFVQRRSKSLVKGKAVAQEEELRRDSAKGKTDLPKVKTEPGPEGITSYEWETPFNLDGIPQKLCERLQTKAPLLLGRDDARYPPTFFVEAFGLSNEGPMPNKVTEAMVPRSWYDQIWPPGDGANKNRHYFRDCCDEVALKKYNQCYMEVYGEAPDNKAFSQSFLRACIYHFKEGHPVNWAGAAAQILEERFQHANLNPLKLRPPALRYQVERILKEVAQFLKDGGCDTWGDGVGAASVGNVKEPHQEGSTGGDTKGCATTKLEELLEEVVRKTAELQAAEKELETKQQSLLQMDERICHFEAEDERLQQHAMLLRKKSKELQRAGDVEEKILNDREIRKVGGEIQANILEWDAADLARTSAKEDVDVAAMKYKKAEEEIADLQEKCKAEKLAQASIKPKAPDGNNGGEAGGDPVLHLDKPCPRCHLKFVANTVFPFSCGCLFHPWCLWAELLAGGRVCPLCKQEGDPRWMAAWGFDVSAPKPEACEDTSANMSSTPKPEVGEDTTINVTSTPVVDPYAYESDEDADMPLSRKRPGSGSFECELPLKMAKLDSEPTPVPGEGESSQAGATKNSEPSPELGKAQHRISTPLSCPTEYISDFPCFLPPLKLPEELPCFETLQLKPSNKKTQISFKKIEAVAKAVAYLFLHSTFLVTLFSFHHSYL